MTTENENVQIEQAPETTTEKPVKAKKEKKSGESKPKGEKKSKKEKAPKKALTTDVVNNTDPQPETPPAVTGKVHMEIDPATLFRLGNLPKPVAETAPEPTKEEPKVEAKLEVKADVSLEEAKRIRQAEKEAKRLAWYRGGRR